MSAVAAKSEPHSEELTRALIEQDAAWEAHGMAQAEAERLKVELSASRQRLDMEGPKLYAFEMISTAIWDWSTSSRESQNTLRKRAEGAEAALKKITKLIENARTEREHRRNKIMDEWGRAKRSTQSQEQNEPAPTTPDNN